MILMSLSGCLNYLGSIASKDVYQLLNDLNGNIALWAEKSKIPSLVFLIAGLVVAAVIGCVGYKMVKPTVAVVLGYFGFFVGVEVYNLLLPKAAWLKNWGVWVIGGLLALLFLAMTLKRASYALVVIAGIGGYVMTSFYIDNTWIAVGGALVVAMITAHLVRTVYILVSSTAAGFLTISLLGEIFPKVMQLQLQPGKWIPLTFVVIAAVLFAMIQGVSNRHRGERL